MRSLSNERGNSPLCRSASFFPLGSLAFFPKSSVSDNDVNCLLAIKDLLRTKGQIFREHLNILKIKDINYMDLDHSIAL